MTELASTGIVESTVTNPQRRKDFLDPPRSRPSLKLLHIVRKPNMKVTVEEQQKRSAPCSTGTSTPHTSCVTVPQQVLHDRGSIGSCNDF
jgi:hypothetical protein